MHTATLLHDDVVDESDVRRGKKAARMIWGNQASVLVGDFLLGQAFRMMVEVGSLPALRILSNAAAVIAEGEVMQLAAAKNTATTEDEYLAIIDAKTAALFSAAAEVGRGDRLPPGRGARRCAPTAATSASPSSSSTTRSTIRATARRLGKSVGDDFREGKITLPVILCVPPRQETEREFWKRTIVAGEIADGDLEHAIGLMKRHKALEATLERARSYGAIARDALAIFPESGERSAMQDVISFCVSRAY